MRDAFSAAIVEAARADERVLLLTGDHGYALFDAFRRECPGQYLNCGIAEQNMVGVAAGLARAGFRPIVYGLAAFVPIRVLEQLKIDVCYEGLQVLLVGDGAGVVYSHLGSSHQSLEDIAAVRALPGLRVYSPADRFELTACMHDALASRAPAYLRMGKADLGDIHADPIDFGSGLFRVVPGGGDTVLLATGSMVVAARSVARGLDGAAVWSVPGIKPLDAAGVLEAVRGRRRVVVLEEHSVVGGLGAAIAQLLVGRFAGEFVQIGSEEAFSDSCGDYRHLLRRHRIDEASIVQRIASSSSAAGDVNRS